MKQNFDIRYFEVLDIDMQKSNQEHHFCISLPNNFWSTKLYRISDWRKGLAVAMYSSASYTNYFLVDKDYNIAQIQQASAKLRNVFVKALLWC